MIVCNQTVSSVGVVNAMSSDLMKECAVDNGDGDKKLDVTDVRHLLQVVDTDSNSSMLKR